MSILSLLFLGGEFGLAGRNIERAFKSKVLPVQPEIGGMLSLILREVLFHGRIGNLVIFLSHDI